MGINMNFINRNFKLTYYKDPYHYIVIEILYYYDKKRKLLRADLYL